MESNGEDAISLGAAVTAALGAAVAAVEYNPLQKFARPT